VDEKAKSKSSVEKKKTSNPIAEKSLDYRCLALTGSFETGKRVPECFAGLSGDFDGQGISFGALQWNFGQSSLQPLLLEMIKKHPKIIKEIFRTHFDALQKALNSDKQKLKVFARSIQHPVKHFVYKPWKGMFRSLGRKQEFQNIQVNHSNKLFKSALRLCKEYELWSERAVALMFDIRVQNGTISKSVKTKILREFKRLPGDLTEDELEIRKMKIVANRRAEASNPKWRKDVRARKLCCANGKGTVHGIEYDLERQYGIGLRDY
jgi:histidinol phosphatase-like enzyme